MSGSNGGNFLYIWKKKFYHAKCKWKIIYIKRTFFLPLREIAKKEMTLKDEQWEILERKALGTIWLSLEESVDFNILKEKKMDGLMKAMAKLYKKPLGFQRYFIRRIYSI